MFLIGTSAYSQYTLVFCEDVTEEGKPVTVSNQFMVDRDGGALRILLRTDGKLNTDKLDFKIFFVGENGVEEEITKLSQATETDWNFVWKEIVMYDPGMYRVKVYNSKGTYLTSANLTLRSR
jgi:hypothetical protein